MAVEIAQSARAAGPGNPCDHLVRPSFLFDLFVYEPMKQHLRGKIGLSDRGLVRRIDSGRVRLFHGLRVLCRLQDGVEPSLGSGDRAQFRQDASVKQMLNNLLGVHSLFRGLLLEEARKALEMLLGAPDRERLVRVGGSKFVV